MRDSTRQFSILYYGIQYMAMGVGSGGQRGHALLRFSYMVEI